MVKARLVGLPRKWDPGLQSLDQEGHRVPRACAVGHVSAWQGTAANGLGYAGRSIALAGHPSETLRPTGPTGSVR